MKKLIRYKTLKSFKIRPSGRSSDFISPDFTHNCLFDCAYCYMRRHIKEKGVMVTKNINEVLTAINNHAIFDTTEKPNQTHGIYTTYDISCNSDIGLDHKYWDWKTVFQFFKDHPIAMGTFATKFVPNDLLEFNPEGKIRIRFSLMPQQLSDILEPNTSKIIDRIKAVDRFIEAGYDVHLNFSPVIIQIGTRTLYKELFKLVDKHITNKIKVEAEVIMMTHSEDMHKHNLVNNPKAEYLLWDPKRQEEKTNTLTGGKAIRYERNKKTKYIKQFTDIWNEEIPWCNIRYIF
jgi:spore photoproduct lyase